MKTTKYEMFYKDKMTFEEYENRAKRIAKAVALNSMMNRMNESDYKNIMIELLQYDNIWEVIYQYIEVMNIDPKTYTSLEGIIAEEIRPTSEESFCKWGDRNHLTRDIKKQYFSKNDFLTLDIQIMIINEEYNKDITENDLIEFICKYPKGSHTYKNEIQVQKEEIMQQFESITKFKLTENFIKTYLLKTQNIIESSEECPF